MDSFEMNKVFAAVISGALIIMVISTVSETVFHREAAEKPAYTIEVAAASTGEAAVVEEGPSLAELLAVADAGKGARQFNKCKACHTTDAGGKNGTGPNLYNLIGRGVAATDGFKFSSALTEKGGTWTYEFLDAWLESPKKTVPGNSMSFAGIRKPGQRADLIAYLRGFADTPADLPAVEAAAEEAPAEAAEEVAAEAPAEGE